MEFSMSVTQLNEYVRKSLAADPVLRRLNISGEISNLKLHSSGHWYFTLKDEEAAVDCVMFRQYNYDVRFMPENGMKVRLLGSVSLWAKTGKYQFYAEAMAEDGLGELYLRFEALKRKLEAQGLFDASLKKPLPLLPKGIGVITSETGAVLHDICRVCWRRFPGMPVFLCPVKVQGEGAAEEIAAALEQMDRLPEADVLIVGRGGGSMEDLWSFNEECVAKAIAACHTPVISAVGHETDFTIADFVADVRAATPSAAAEIAVPSRLELLGRIEGIVDILRQDFSYGLRAKAHALESVRKRLELLSPEKRSERLLEKTESLKKRIRLAFDRQLSQKQYRMENAWVRIRSAGPEAAFERGYALISSGGKAIRNVTELKPGLTVTLRLKGGQTGAVITDYPSGGSENGF